METLTDILKSYGLIHKQGTEYPAFDFITDTAMGTFQEGKEIEHIFKRKMMSYTYYYIDDIERFVEKFDLKDKWNPLLYPALKEAIIKFDEKNYNFKILAQDLRPLEVVWRNQTYWYQHSSMKIDQIGDFFEEIYPGFRFLFTFNPLEVEENLGKKLKEAGENIAISVKQVPLVEMKKRIYESALKEMMLELTQREKENGKIQL